METDRKTVVAEPSWVTPALLVGFTLLGAVTAWALQAASAWLATMPWVPRRRLFEWVAEQPDARRLTVAIGGGLILGLLVGLSAIDDLVVITVGPEEATMVRGRKRLHVPRGAVAAVYRDGKHIVVRDQVGEERWRIKVTLDAAAVRDAFVRYGYPWREGPP